MANEMKSVTEFIQRGLGTEGTLLLPRKIAETLVEEVGKNLIPRSEAALYFGPGDIPGQSVDVDLETPDTQDVRVVGEGASFPMDVQEYTTFNMKPLKYGVSIRITREALEDFKWNLLERNTRTAGKRLAENENSLIITLALDNAANTVSGGGAVSIANITRAIQHLHDSDYSPTTLVIGPEVWNDLQNIDTFVEYDKVGNRDMLERGFLGRLYGLNVIVASKNAGMTTTSAYVFDNRHAFVIAEKRTVTVENFDLPQLDMSAAVVSQRITVRHLRSAAIAKITSS